jgi:hypothetical protein
MITSAAPVSFVWSSDFDFAFHQGIPGGGNIRSGLEDLGFMNTCVFLYF